MSARPVIAGFYPDPSVCRVGDDYYLAASSFEYLPGVPIFHSRDLVNWAQIGNVLDRPDQLELSGAIEGASRGIYAPSLRHHDHKFWMITTDVDRKGDGHLIVSADDPAGPWSAPVYTAGAVGIDPDLAWDGVDCYLTWKNEAVGEGGIWQARVDPLSGRLLSDPLALWAGTGLAHTEGPHIFRNGEWWYLLVAEGGTDRGHAVSIARSGSPSGPFEPYAANPIFSHRSLDDPQQSTGHPDMLECADGTWAMVYLGVQVRGAFPRFHVNGRETFLAGIDWIDGWPVVVENRFEVAAVDHSFVDDFESDTLHPRWISPGRHPALFARREPHGVLLQAGREPWATRSRALLAVRARDHAWVATALVVSGNVALQVRIDDEHWFAAERIGGLVRVRSVIGATDNEIGQRRTEEKCVTLFLRSVPAEGVRHRLGPDRLEAGFIVAGVEVVLGTLDGRYISSEIAGGFTGRVVGVEALGGSAIVERFAYRSSPDQDGDARG